MQMKGRVSSIPALRAPDGSWVKDPAGKATLFAKTFAAKQALPAPVVTEYTPLLQAPDLQVELEGLSVENVEQVLASLREDSATGPDQLPTRVLKKCAHILAKPVCHWLAQRILDSGQWPVKWREHWIAQVYKKKSVYDSRNYMGHPHHIPDVQDIGAGSVVPFGPRFSKLLVPMVQISSRTGRREGHGIASPP